MEANIVVIGGGYAGALATARLARRGNRVTLIDAGDGLVERIRLHQVMAGDDVAKVPFARLFRKLPVEVVQARVTGIDRARKRVLTAGGSVPYDRLVYALGSAESAPEHALSVGNPLAVREALKTATSVLVVGGGLTGIESAAEIAERHPHIAVTLADAGTIGGDLSEGGKSYLRERLQALRIELLDRTRIACVIEGGVILATGETLAASVVLWCGSFSVSPIAREAGLHVNARGQIIVDEQLRSSDPSIHAIGDAAAFSELRMGCVSAMPMGAFVADVLSGDVREPFRFAFQARCISLGRTEGLIQFVDHHDHPRERFITGRAGAWVKELVCRYAVTAVKLEARGLAYRWPKAAWTETLETARA